MWCTFEIVCVSPCLEFCWIFFQIHKESLSGYFTVWVYTASFPWQVIIEYRKVWVQGWWVALPCFFCKCMRGSSFGILNVHESSKGTWWLICTIGQSWHKNCSWVQQDCTRVLGKSHNVWVRLSCGYDHLLQFFMTLLLGKAFVFP